MHDLRRAVLAPLVIVLAHASHAQTPVTDSTATGLVGYWAFDEGDGDRSANSVRRGADIFGNSGAARVLAPVWVSGRHGEAMDFGQGATAVIVDKTAEMECHEGLTIAAWVKLENPTGRGMILSHEYAYRLCVNQAGENRVRLQLNLDGKWAQNWLAGKTSLEAGKWYYVAGVYDGKQRRIYINGKLDAAEPCEGLISDGRGFFIGAQGVQHRKKHVLKQAEAAQYTVSNPFPGVVDEVKVWNRALSGPELVQAADQDRAAVISLLPEERSLYFYAVKCVGMSGQDEPYRIAAFNGGAAPYVGTITLTVADADGAPIHEAQRDISVGPRRKIIVELPIRAARPGLYTLAVSSAGRRLFEMPVCVLAPVERRPVGEPALKRIISIDLTSDLGRDTLCDDGTSHVVRSAIGAYREAGEKKFSRFVVRLPLRRPGLHIVRVTYPDDKPRTCEIASWSPDAADRFNAHTGYFTGDDLPISGRFRTFEFVMWARDVNQALVFTTWLDGQPAAASAIDVFEVQARLPSRPASRAPSRRLIGHYWEDAQPLSRCFGGDAPELMDFDRVVRNMCDYFDYTGQNLLMHPLVWYEGPIYNSLVEARGSAGGFYLPTAGWVDILLRRFEERGFKFYATFNVYRLPSLVRTMNGDIASIQAGEPTVNTVSKDNEAWIGTRPHRSPVFNALHPQVQGAVLALVREIADRYASSPAFAGVAFHLTMPSLLELGGLDVSYDDWTVAEFARDTRIAVPVAANDPERFSKRHDWIIANAKDEWIRWRCERMADYFGRVAQVLRSKRPDLQLVVTILEPPMSIIDPQRIAWMEGKPLVEMSREAGIDPALLAKHPGVVIQQRLGPTARRKRLTFGVTRGRWGCPPPTPENINAIRAMDLDQEQQRQFRTTADFGVFLYNRYFESAVGRTDPLKCDWYKSIPWRASAVVPSGDNFMEYYARALAMFDPTFIAIGGFTNGTVGHEARVERFARVFRQLPAGKWRDVAGLPGDVSGRATEADGKRYLYLVNLTAQTKRVVLPIAERLQPIAESPELSQTQAGQTAVLAPYQLAAWVGD